MQTDIRAVTVTEEPVDDAGQTENLSDREKKTSLFTKCEPTAAPSMSLHAA